MKQSALLLLLAFRCAADTGVLLPQGRNEIDASVFSLDEMTVDIVIDNGDASVSIRQIFGNHSNGVLEGNFTFALPSRSLVSDFAVWDDVTRIPGVILERARAEQIYDSLHAQSIDPGLLQQGDREAGEPRAAMSSALVSCPFRRTEPSASRLPTSNESRLRICRSEFALPLRPSAYPRANRRQAGDQPGIAIRSRDPPVRATGQALSTAHRRARYAPGESHLRRTKRQPDGRFCGAIWIRCHTRRHAGHRRLPRRLLPRSLVISRYLHWSRIQRSPPHRNRAPSLRCSTIRFPCSGKSWSVASGPAKRCCTLRPVDSLICCYSTPSFRLSRRRRSPPRLPTWNRRSTSCATAAFAEAPTCSAP